MRRPLFVTAALIIAMAAAGISTPSMAAQPDCLPGNAFENDEVRIWFHAQKGFVKVFDKNDTGAYDGMYQYKTGAIRENTTEGDVAWMNLERAFPQTSTCLVEETDEWVNMTLEVTDTVRATNGGAVGDATVTFAYHYNKTGNGAKFDLFVADWPWQSDDSELAFEFDIQTSDYEIEPAENGVGFSDDGEPAGYITWAPNATATYEDDSQETAIVDSTVDVDGGNAAVKLQFTQASAGYVDLAYDPFVGVGPYLIILGILIPLADVADLPGGGIIVDLVTGVAALLDPVLSAVEDHVDIIAV